MVSAAETVSHETPPEDLRSCPDHRVTEYSSTMESCSQQSDSTTLMTIPAEIRLDIYKHSFAMPTKITLRRCDETDDEELSKRLSTSLIPSLLATCHQIHREALPMFYGSQNFYIPIPYLKITGSEAHKQPSVHENRLLYARNHLGLITHSSLGWDTGDLYPSGNDDHVDHIVAAGVKFFVDKCSRLRKLTLNFLPSDYSLMLSFHFHGGDATAKALHTLRNHLDELTIIALGYPFTLYQLRRKISEDLRPWKHEIDANAPWPGISLMSEQQNTLVELQRRSRPINKYTLAWKPCRPGVVGRDVRSSLESSTNAEQVETLDNDGRESTSSGQATMVW